MSDERPEPARTENSVGDVSGGTTMMGRDITVNMVGPQGGGAPLYAVPAPPLFVNRDGELERARDFALDGGPHARVLVVQATPRGSGATAFGLKVLHEVFVRDPRRFSGGYFFADVERDGVAESVSEILRRMGVEEIPAGQRRRRDRLQGEFAGRGAVAVLVDAPAGVNDVLPFVSTAPGSLTVVATAHDFEFDEVLPHVQDEWIGIGALAAEHAVELLCAKAGVEPETDEDRRLVEDLAGYTGGSPHLLLQVGRNIRRLRRRRAAGALAAVHRSLIVPAPAGPRDGDGEGAGLPAPVRAAAVALSCHPETDFGAGVAARVLPGEDAGALLAALVEGDVLTAAPGGRYRFRTARAQRELGARAHDRAAVFGRVLEYYFGLAAAAHRALLPGRWLQADLDHDSAFPDTAGPRFEDGGAARLALEPDRAALRAAVMHAAVRGEHRRAAELCEHLWAYWFTSGLFADVVDTHTEVLRHALGTHRLSPARLSRLCVQRSIAYRRDGSLEQAREDAELALELARDAEPVQPPVLLTALEAVGDVEREEGRPAPAAERFAEALAVAEAAEPLDPRAVLNASRKLAQVRLEQGDRDAARGLLVRARDLVLLKRPDDLHNRARVGAALGDLLLACGDRERALEQWDAAAELHTRLGDDRRTGDMCVKRADALEPTDPAAARAALETALEHYTRAGARHLVAQVRYRLADPG
ncbi:hypothetical protein [Nocardiopsis sp. NPDC057823]|uniref:hypothetical protein n=1 Tax=Nocardiopsis sp. NPDC057823 TaxID=3346256 RepID=UPI00367061B6